MWASTFYVISLQKAKALKLHEYATCAITLGYCNGTLMALMFIGKHSL